MNKYYEYLDQLARTTHRDGGMYMAKYEFARKFNLDDSRGGKASRILQQWMDDREYFKYRNIPSALPVEKKESSWTRFMKFLRREI